MKFLAYDTSSETLSIALFENDTLIAEREFPLFTRHSADLAPSLEKVFRENKMRPEELEVIAVGLGPGSFTGLRVGIATAKVMAYALKKKIVGIPSIEAIAHAAVIFGNRVAVIMDAKKNRIYSALYEKRGSRWATLQKPSLRELNGVTAAVKKPTCFVGDAVPFYREAIERKKKLCRAVEDSRFYYPRASVVGQLAWVRIKKKKFTDPFRLEPLYLHPRDCNVTPPPV